MRQTCEPKLALYAGIGALALALGLLLSQPGLVLIGAPFVLAIIFDLGERLPQQIAASLAPLPKDALEGEELRLSLDISAESGAIANVAVPLPPELELTQGANPITFVLAPGTISELELGLCCAHWGVGEIAEAAIRTRTTFGLVSIDRRLSLGALIRVFPLEPTLRGLVRPLETQLFAGNQRARAKGDGIEYADVREYRPGDRPRAINWRASARRGILQTNERYPERNADITILLDSIGNGVRGSGRTFDDAVRATSALVRQALARGDRVGLLNCGGAVQWVELRTGIRQLYRIVDVLLAAEVGARTLGEQLRAVPRQVLSPRALVIALTPLLDERSVDVLIDLRARGYDLVVVEIVAEPELEQGMKEIEPSLRFRDIVREALRSRFISNGIPIVRWQPQAEFEQALEEVRAFRRDRNHAWA